MNTTTAPSPIFRFARYVGAYKPLLTAALFFAICKLLLGYTFPILTGEATNLFSNAGRFEGMTRDERMHWLEWIVGAGIVASLLHGVLWYARGQTAAVLGNRVIRDLRQDLFDHLHRLSLHFYSKQRSGSIVSRLITDISQASQIVNGGVINVVMDMCTLIVGVFLLGSISWKLTAATLVILPLYGFGFFKLSPQVRQASRRSQSSISRISGSVQERLAGIALVKTYAAEPRERDLFREQTEAHLDRVIVQSRLGQLLNSLSELLIHVGQTVVIGYGGYLVLEGELSPGEVIKFLGFLAVMYFPVRRFSEINVIWQQSMASIERVFQVFEITPIIQTKPGAVNQPPQRGEVEFDEVRFRFPGDEVEKLEHPDHEEEFEDKALPLPPRPRSRRPQAPGKWVLDGISLTVQAGEKVAFVGPSGAGKTTLVSLLPRLYDVTEGRILVDGVDVRDYNQRVLRQAIGIVQQDSFLLSGTVWENIAYGRPDATFEQVMEAARSANAHDFIEQLPEGYDSPLGERGVNLSGGQRQRLSIARAILKDPRVLILDEATSALDTESEVLVQQALERLMRDRTALIIAHRLSTVRNADRIYVMEHGRVVEVGRHDALVARGGLYARLVRQQFGLEEEASPSDIVSEAPSLI